MYLLFFLFNVFLCPKQTFSLFSFNQYFSFSIPPTPLSSLSSPYLLHPHLYFSFSLTSTPSTPSILPSLPYPYSHHHSHILIFNLPSLPPSQPPSHLHALKDGAYGGVGVEFEPLPAGTITGFVPPRPPFLRQQLLERVDGGGGAGDGEVSDKGGTIHHGHQGTVHPPPTHEHLMKGGCTRCYFCTVRLWTSKSPKTVCT